MRAGVRLPLLPVLKPGRRLLAASAAALLLGPLGALPAFPATATTPQHDAAVQALTRAQAAVVGVDVQATAGARSSETLGRQRSGSGVVIGADGLVLTIGYLLLEADTIQVVTHDRRTLPARLVAYDLATGFGLVRPLLPLRGITPVTLGTLSELSVGDALMVASGGEDADVGLVRAVGKRPFSGYWEYHIDEALFTSPPVDNHSGAAVFNQRGELLGVGSLFVGDAGGQGRRLPGNMFVPVDLLKPILAELQQTGTTRQSQRPWLGLTSGEQGGRVLVLRVNDDSPAKRAGIQPGDAVLAVDGQPVGSLETFYKKLWDRTQPEADVQLTVQQGTESRTVTVRTVDRMSTMAKPAGI